jgi:hypothetical protein
MHERRIEIGDTTATAGKPAAPQAVDAKQTVEQATKDLADLGKQLDEVQAKLKKETDKPLDQQSASVISGLV